jgi:hypothetical protein
MRDVLVRCGGAQARRPPGTDVLDIDVDAPKGNPGKVRLSLERITVAMVQNVPDALADLVEIACYIYSADQFTRRESSRMPRLGENWRRGFRFVIPVRDLQTWERPAVLKVLADTLGFLSEDTYEFRFVPRQTTTGLQPYLDLTGDGPAPGFTPDKVILFSGGLDSLAGAAQALMKERQRVALVSHQSSPMVRSKQLHLVAALRDRGPPSSLFHVSVLVTKGQREAVEFTQRSRSFLFAALGFVVARLFRRTEITFFENGVMSMNLPIARHVIGSRATRTTHPRVLSNFGKLFSLIAGEEVRVPNPFFWLTKGEVLRRLGEVGCSDLIEPSFSCTRVRSATQTKTHCGLCSQCVDRRFAILAAGLQAHEPVETYAVDLLRGERSPGPDVTLAESYVLTAAAFARLSPVAFAARYGEVFRALPYLEEGSPDLNLHRIHELHSRHGASVAGVIQREVASLSLSEMLSLPKTSLLALVQSNVAEAPVQLDLVETERSASEQAADMKDKPIQRPISFGIDELAKRIIFASGVHLSHSGYQLFKALLSEFDEDQAAGCPADKCRYVPAKKVAERLDVEEHTVRHSVGRTRKALTRMFLEHAHAQLGEQDVIQTRAWEGYRLNPFLDKRPLSFMLGGQPSVKTSRETIAGVTTRRPRH